MSEPASRPCRIILLGMMGSGKSTVGSLLAERTGWPFHDNDAMLRELFDATPREILAAGDEDSLLTAEVAALQAGLKRPAPSVVAAAGRTIEDASTRDALAEAGIPIWLRITEETILRRSRRGVHRPWPDADRAAWISRTVAHRHDLYASVADLTLDADDATPSDLADRILAHARTAGTCAPMGD